MNQNGTVTQFVDHASCRIFHLFVYNWRRTIEIEKKENLMLRNLHKSYSSHTDKNLHMFHSCATCDIILWAIFFLQLF